MDLVLIRSPRGELSEILILMRGKNFRRSISGARGIWPTRRCRCYELGFYTEKYTMWRAFDPLKLLCLYCWMSNGVLIIYISLKIPFKSRLQCNWTYIVIYLFVQQ